MPAIGLIILAAGGSTRLGTPKQLLQYDGKSLLRRAIESAVASGCRPIMAVLGAAAEECQRELLGMPLASVVNADWEEGMGSSLRLGLKTLLAVAPLSLEAVVIILCDQPLLTAETLDTLVHAYEATSSPIVASEYGQVCGVPALFDRSLFPELLSLSGAQGAKQILQRYANQTHKIAFAGGAIDIDTPADIARLGSL